MSSSEHVDTDLPHDEKKTKSRRPPNTAFRQQRLKAWQPILTPKTVLPLFFAIGVIFAPLGGGMLWASADVSEIQIDYSACSSLALNESTTIPQDKLTSVFKSSNAEARNAVYTHTMQDYTFGNAGYSVPLNTCTIDFNIPTDIGPPVFLYYRLTNFYQNHRRYVNSINQDQLNGDAVSFSDIQKSTSGTGCSPLAVSGDSIIYPCGLIANSVFNDTFSSPVLLNAVNSSASNETYQMSNTNVAWSSDASLYKQTKYNISQIVPPPNWHVRYPFGYNNDFPVPTLHDDDNFQVWMRTAGLPTFSKLALRNDNQTMKAGRYRISVRDSFPVLGYDGTKSILISTRTILGGKNPFLGIAYIVVGGVCILFGAVFTITQIFKPRKLGDHTYLTWNDDQPSAATVATGRSLRQGDA